MQDFPLLWSTSIIQWHEMEMQCSSKVQVLLSFNSVDHLSECIEFVLNFLMGAY